MTMKLSSSPWKSPASRRTMVAAEMRLTSQGPPLIPGRTPVLPAAPVDIDAHPPLLSIGGRVDAHSAASSSLSSISTAAVAAAAACACA